MERLINEISTYASARGLSPQRVIREALNAEWGRWERWVAGISNPRADTIDRVRAYMAAHPPKEDGK